MSIPQPSPFRPQLKPYTKGKSGLPFLSITLGVILGGLSNTHHTLTTFTRAVSSGTRTPETRLPPMILGGCLLPPGLFLFAWTSCPAITPWPQIVAGVLMGAGILLILLNGLNYIVDVYGTKNANSAIAANTVVRSLFGAVFPLFAAQMYARLLLPSTRRIPVCLNLLSKNIAFNRSLTSTFPPSHQQPLNSPP